MQRRDKGQWIIDNGQLTIDNGQLTIDKNCNNHWTLNYKQKTTDNRHYCHEEFGSADSDDVR